MKAETKIDMLYKKETKRTVVYECEGGVVSQVYVNKSGLPDTPPIAITLTVAYGTDEANPMDEAIDL